MTTICVQCWLRALIALPPTSATLPARGTYTFDEAPEAHRRRLHPDAHACLVEHRALERQLSQRISQAEARSASAHTN